MIYAWYGYRTKNKGHKIHNTLIHLKQSFTSDSILWGFIYFHFPQSMSIIFIQCVYHYLFEKNRRQGKKKKCFPNSPLRPFNYRIYFAARGPTKHDKNEPVESCSLPHRIPKEEMIIRRECCCWRISLQEKRGAFKMYPHIIPNQHFICKYNPESTISSTLSLPGSRSPLDGELAEGGR